MKIPFPLFFFRFLSSPPFFFFFLSFFFFPFLTSIIQKQKGDTTHPAHARKHTQKRAEKSVRGLVSPARAPFYPLACARERELTEKRRFLLFFFLIFFFSPPPLLLPLLILDQ